MKDILHIRHQFLSFCTFFFQFGYNLVQMCTGIKLRAAGKLAQWEKNTFLRDKNEVLSALTILNVQFI